MVFVCNLSKAVNIQVVEGHDAPQLADGLMRLCLHESTPRRAHRHTRCREPYAQENNDAISTVPRQWTQLPRPSRIHNKLHTDSLQKNEPLQLPATRHWAPDVAEVGAERPQLDTLRIHARTHSKQLTHAQAYFTKLPTDRPHQHSHFIRTLPLANGIRSTNGTCGRAIQGLVRRLQRHATASDDHGPPTQVVHGE